MFFLPYEDPRFPLSADLRISLHRSELDELEAALLPSLEVGEVACALEWFMLAVGSPMVSMRVGTELGMSTSMWMRLIRTWLAQIPSRVDFDALAWHWFRLSLIHI